MESIDHIVESGTLPVDTARADTDLPLLETALRVLGAIIDYRTPNPRDVAQIRPHGPPDAEPDELARTVIQRIVHVRCQSETHNWLEREVG